MRHILQLIRPPDPLEGSLSFSSSRPIVSRVPTRSSPTQTLHPSNWFHPLKSLIEKLVIWASTCSSVANPCSPIVNPVRISFDATPFVWISLPFGSVGRGFFSSRTVAVPTATDAGGCGAHEMDNRTGKIARTRDIALNPILGAEVEQPCDFGCSLSRAVVRVNPRLRACKCGLLHPAHRFQVHVDARIQPSKSGNTISRDTTLADTNGFQIL